MADEEESDAGVLIANFLRSTAEERENWLVAIQRRLPSWIRVYDRNGLSVYYDAEAKTPLPSWLTLPATYIEIVSQDESAKIVKGGFGPVALTKTTEPKKQTNIERLFGEDLV